MAFQRLWGAVIVSNLGDGVMLLFLIAAPIISNRQIDRLTAQFGQTE